MRSRPSLLPIAVVLAVCLWTSVGMAQAVTMLAAASQESRLNAHAEIAPHGTGGLPVSTQAVAGPLPHSAAKLRQQALVAMETLREEIATLAALKHAQAALLAWNRDRTEGSEAPVFLASALCAEPALGAWCPLLPATFGTPSPTAEESHDRD
ncbi:MAG: hypothetical protein OXE50_14880 [Chloroflexi bacterium]|nr:hypothetical protein [Chloroflexota bacterium]